MEQEFFDYLASLSVSPKTLKNYRSDINHFLDWLCRKIKLQGVFVDNFEGAITFISPEVGYQYKNSLSTVKTPAKTANRRLSTLRHLARFLLSSQILDFDFMAGQANLSEYPLKRSESPILLEFKSHLEAEKVAKNTVKSYLSDIRQFLTWLEHQNA